METYKNKKGVLSSEAFRCIICGIDFHKNFMSKQLQICKACNKEEKVDTNGNRVFVLNFIGKDMSDAKQYGFLVPITEGSIDVFNLDRIKWNLEKALDNYKFDEKNDYILLSGGNSLNFMIGNIMTKRYKKIKLLLWDAKNRKYIIKEISL